MRVIALLAVLVAFSAVIAQPDGGCCFYREKGFVDEIRCTNEPVINISVIVTGKKDDFIQSYFCTESYSAAVFSKGEIKELVDCGDVVNETMIPMPVEFITVGECLIRRCCFYTGASKDGTEYCVNDVSATPEELVRVQATDNFLVAECVREFAATLTTIDKKVIPVGCGETLDIPKSTKFSGIAIRNCPATSQAVDEAFDDQLLDPALIDSFDAQFGDDDELAADQAVADESFDQAVADESFDENLEASFESELVDQAVADSLEDSFNADNFDQNMESNFDAEFVDQAVGDEAFDENMEASFESELVDQAVADSLEDSFNADNFDQNMESNFDAEFVDQAVGDAQSEEEYFFVDEFVDQAVGETYEDQSLEENFDFSDSFNEMGSDHDD